ncbi:MAG: exo-beta-N-acetylmuramidase NamZ family protein, partial [bacterium]
STMLECMKAVASTEIPFIILDRPNPIDGTRVEGPLLEKNLESFVGIAHLPIRHGMTPGELALLLTSELKLNLDLRIVPLAGWHRSELFDETGLQWIAPSPNIPTPATAAVYPGMCLIEGTNLSEGRGTTLPFQLVGSPWLDAGEVCSELNQLGLGGVRFRPQNFTPTSSKFKGLLCRGIQIHVLDQGQFQPIPVALHLLQRIHAHHSDQLKFNNTFFDKLAGNSWIRTRLLEGTNVKALVDRWQPELNGFKRIRDKYLLY